MVVGRFYLIAAIAIITVGGAIVTFGRSSQVTKAWVEEVKLPLDEYTHSISSFAIDGNTAVYCILQTPPNSKPQEVINIYTHTAGNWSLQAQLPFPKKQSSLGYAESSHTAINGNIVLVGVNVFVREGNTWSLKTQLQPPTSEDLGIVNSVATSGNAIVIDTKERTHVFRRNPDTDGWFFEAELKTDEVYPPRYGRKLDIDGNTIVVGSQIFERNSDGSWVESARLSLNGEKIPPIESVAISANTVVIGSPRDYIKDARGSVYIFEKNPATGVWSYQTTLEPNEVPNLIGIYYGFGFSVEIDENTIVIGTGVPKTGSLDLGWRLRGNAYVFVRDNRGRWLFQQKLVPKDYQQVADNYGQMVRISGSWIIVYGGPLKEPYVFRKVNSL